VLASVTIRAWWRLARQSLRTIVPCAALLAALAFPARAANFTDIWWNSDESGWGLTVAHHDDKVFAIWYVYDESGKPLWATMSNGVASADGRSFSGEVHTANGPSYRDPDFRWGRVRVAHIGNARIDFAPDDTSATVTYTLFGKTTSKSVKRQGFGSAPANAPHDLGDLWWNAEESGWGVGLHQHGDNIFGIWYTYDLDEKPLWVVMPGGTFEGNTFTATLYTTTGTPFDRPFVAADTKPAVVGTAKLVFEGDVVKFTGTIHGHTKSRTLTRQPFGTRGSNQPPKVGLSLAGAQPAIAPASVTLEASATDADGTVAKVSFFLRSEKIGEVAAPPYRMQVAGLPEGKHHFSAQATDNRGARALATARFEVTIAGAPPTANKSPKVSLTAPAGSAWFAQGAPVALSANASDPDGGVARVEFFANDAKVGEAIAPPWSATWTQASPGAWSITAVATDDRGASTASAPVAIYVAGPAAVVDAPTRDAARFLTQATFGMRGTEEVDSLKSQGYASWLDSQFSQVAASHVQYVNDRKAAGEKAYEERAYEAIWQQWLTEPGQLRARMSFALSEIFVISNVAPDLHTYALASYMDMLNRNAFGNYRQLLEEVTLHPAMGYYLNMIGSKKADPARGTHPNENYAREVMQLFSIGLYRLNPDGTRILDGQGQPVPTYDESVVKALAAAFTGWNFAGNDTSKPGVFDPAKENWLEPLLPWEMWHDTGAKTLFDGITLPPGQGARKDMKDALDALFNHPNVGPFVGRQLIQRFVTSNPSPAYIARVAGAFANNGQGVRGDLRAVVRAVLLDPEARDLARAAEPGWGKQREPVIRFANFLRAFKATSPSGRNRIGGLDSADEGLGQSPLLAPSVFNFFSPNYRHPGALAAAGLVAPEFQITTETSMVGGLNFFAKLVRRGYYGKDETRLTMDLAELNGLASDPPALVDRLNVLFMNGAMSAATRNAIVAVVGGLALPKTDAGAAIADRAKAALLMVALSPEFTIQK
jgi:uncharacterized protein (DUF1800 family)